MASLEIPEDLDLSNLTQKEKFLILDKVISNSKLIFINLQIISIFLKHIKLFFRVLSSETDLDFEESLKTFLPKLLLKLGTSEEVIRKKVFR